MEFKKKIKTRICTAVIYGIVGAMMCIVSYFSKAENEMLSTFGTVLLVIGIAKAWQNTRIIKNEELLQQREIAEKDERNISIWYEARSMAFGIYMMIAAVAVIVLYLLNMQLAGQVVAYSVMTLTFIYWICYKLVSRKY